MRMGVILLSFLLLVQSSIIFASGYLHLKACGTYHISYSSDSNSKLFYLNGELVSKNLFCKSIKLYHANHCFIKDVRSHCYEVDHSSGGRKILQNLVKNGSLEREEKESKKTNDDKDYKSKTKYLVMGGSGILFLCCSFLCCCFRARKKDIAHTVLANEPSSRDTKMSNNTSFEDEVDSGTSSRGGHSIVWNYFTRLPVGVEGVKKASCDGCGNFTYLMLESALAYKRAYARLALVDSNYKTFPTEEEWRRVETITKFLKPFYDITTLFSGSSYPTSNLYFRKVWNIQMLIEKEIHNSDQVISDMAMEMKQKFEKYWENYSVVLSFAAILDPRYKLKIVEYCFSQLNMSKEEYDEKVKTIFKGIHKLYDNEYGARLETMNDTLSAGSSNVGVDILDELCGFESFQSQFENVENEKSQLDLYLEEPPLDHKQELDILQYWKDNQGRYPQLALMARDILSIPITTVASESSFSIGGQVISKYRSSLASSNVEALLCTRDWLFGLVDESGTEMEEGIVEDIEALIPTPNSRNA